MSEIAMEIQINNTKVKKKPTKIEDMTKEQIRDVITKKRECNAKAQTIVESLLEKDVTEFYFLQCLPDINQSHFEDIVEERAIIHLCGYPTCQNTLSVKDIPKQKYRISIKTNKVYDITARKSFCSNNCYKAATFVKKQMLTSPLWFREYEEIPTFHLLPSDTTGSLGEEVDVALIEKINVKSEMNQFSSINDFASASLNEMTSTGNELDNIEAKEIIENVGDNLEKNDKEKSEEKRQDSDQSDSNEMNKENTKPAIVQTKKQNPLNIVGDIVEKPERKIDPILVQKPESNSKPQSKPEISKKQLVTVLTIEVEKCLAEWLTLDSLLFLFGEEKVKEMVTDKGECIKEYLDNYANSTAYNCNTYDQYQALCRKLNMLDLDDRKYDAQTLQRETKPLPDYSMLQEESKRMQLKVTAFFAGETVIPEVEKTQPTTATDEEERLTQLPLVDKNAQNMLRRRIVSEQLNKVLPDLLRSLGLLSLSISSDVRLLVNTLRLKANNIMFKPVQWTLIAIIVLKLLSLRDAQLADLMEQPTAYQHLQLLLLSYKQDGGYLERLVSWLIDIDRLLDTNDVQLTLE